jgi:hypothetical protein
MRSYLLSIGCDNYSSETLNNLSGAINDALNIYNCLVNSEYSIYDKDKSTILESPTVAEVRAALEKTLIDNETPDVFSLFFAGHGGVSTGTYYICLNDTRTDRLEFTALSLSEIFRMVSSSGVKHVNLIIDACNTGGLVNDLTSIIKPDLIGAKGSFGIAILAAAASDEYAGEINGQGLLTSNLIKYINGERRINTNSEYLDLVTVGRQVSIEFIEKSSAQTPSSWGINLYGPSVFSKNPFYNHSDTIGTYEFSYIPPASRLGLLIQGAKNEFWEALESIDTDSGSRKLLTSFQKLLSSTDNSNDALALITGIGYRFVDQVETTSDLRKLDLLNVLLTALMPYLGNENANIEIDKLIDDFNQFGEICMSDLQGQLDADDNFLIYKGGSGFDVLSNYYYLSIRISKILGFLSQLVLINSRHLPVALSIIEIINSKYHNHLMCMCDNQAPYLYVFFKVFRGSGMANQAKALLLKYLVDYLRTRGQVSRINLQPDRVLSYLLQRYTQDKIDIEHTANPAGIGTVLLLATSDYGLADELDKQMHVLDRCCFHLFIPSKVNEFSQNLIEDGQNLVLRCGFDFWNVKEFVEMCLCQIESYADNSYLDINKRSLVCCIASAFSQPDRIPLMLK